MDMGRLIIVLIIAAVIAGAVFFVTRNMQPAVPPAQVSAPVVTPVKQQTTDRVLVATQDVPAGTLLQNAEANFTYKEWPQDSIDPENYIVGDVPVSEFNGAVARQGVFAGEPVVRDNLLKPGDVGFLAVVLEPGMRAVSIRVDENTGVAGFVFPGDRVDLVLSHSVNIAHGDGEARPHTVSETFLHDLRVVAVDQKSSDQDPVAAVASVVTLETKPEQAERIALASRMGEVRLALRSMVRNKDGGDGLGGESGLVGILDSVDLTGMERTFTLDSDLSQIISPPTGGEEERSSGLQVIRGEEVMEVEAK